jgi:hypothetical protein
LAKEFELILKNLRGHVLSPGNIFWIQKSGAKVSIAKKSDFLNYQLIEKLFKADHQLIIEDPISLEVQDEFLTLTKAHSSELLFKEKLKYQKRILDLFDQHKLNQSEVSQLTWLAWSAIDAESIKTLIDFDLDFFKRSLNVATGIVFCAIMLGYYKDEFLKNLFNSSLKELMSMEKIELMDSMKAELDGYRKNDSLSDEAKFFFKKAYPKTMSWAAERYDGSGVNSFNLKEMSDLEIVMVSLERHYSYKEVECDSIFEEIKNGKFKCNEKILSVLRKSLMKEAQNSIDSAMSA